MISVVFVKGDPHANHRLTIGLETPNLSVPGKTVPIVPVSGSGSAPGPP